MTATVALGNGSFIQFDPVQGGPSHGTGVLVTITGKRRGGRGDRGGRGGRGDLLTCGLIPLDRIGAVIESLRLVASQVPA